MGFENINIRHLRVFVTVVDSKSISKASDQVFLSQPAITQAIAKLEMTLQTKLFERRSDGMYVTESGTAFAFRVHRALELIQNGLKDAIRIGAGKERALPVPLLALITTTQLRALLAVSEAQNFSVAGRNLGISQSSLHRAARELESCLSIVLFEKTSIGISASKAARKLAKATRLAFAEIAQGWDEVSALHHREVGRVVVGGMPLARSWILPMAIIEFSNNYPEFKISVNDGPYDDLLYHLRQGEIDLLIGALRFPLPSDDLIQEELFTSAIEIVARPSHPLCQLDVITAEALAQYSWVVPRIGTPTRTIFESIFNDAAVSVPQRLVESGSQALIRFLLLGSDRLALISEHQIQQEISAGTLVIVPYDLSRFVRPIGITMRKAWKPTNTQLSFLKILRKIATL